MPNVTPGQPGSLDGPPAREPRNLGEQLGMATAILLCGSVSVLTLAAVWWAIAWLIANIPGVS